LGVIAVVVSSKGAEEEFDQEQPLSSVPTVPTAIRATVRPLHWDIG